METSSYPTTYSPFVRQPNRKPAASMYSEPVAEPVAPAAGMYSQPSMGGISGGAPSTGVGMLSSPLDFNKLQAGGTNEVTAGDTSIRSAGPDQTGMYSAYTGLLGTGLQTQAQQNVAKTQIQPAMAKLNLQQSEYFPFLKELLLKNGLGGGLGGLASSLISTVANSANPSYEQAAINAAEADTKRAQAEGLLDQYGRLGSADSPQAVAARATAAASQAGNYQDAQRKIRDEYAQRRVGNMASAISAQNSSMAPLYSLFGSLLG